MKVLLSAYECQPNIGSELGLGWAWAMELAAMGHEIWVITLSDNQSKIEQELRRKPNSRLHFIYCKMTPWLPWAYRATNLIRSQISAQVVAQIAKVWWQWEAYQIAKILTKEVKFDLVHHVTNSTVRRPSFMGLLGIPFIFGPLAGGVKAPWSLRKSYPSIGWRSDLLRDLANGWIRFDPLMNLSFASALRIYCDSTQTLRLIPKVYHSKSMVLFSVPNWEMLSNCPIVQRESTETELFRVLYVGRFLYWKGIHLALKAFAQLHHKIPQARFTLIGAGRQEAWLRRVAAQLDIEEVVDWIPWMEQKQLSSAYLQHDVLLFPSLHDTSPNVILESLHHGLPIVCLDLGGPGVMVDETCGRVIETNELGESEVIFALSNALLELAENPELRLRLRKGALARVSEFTFKDVLEQIYRELILY